MANLLWAQKPVTCRPFYGMTLRGDWPSHPISVVTFRPSVRPSVVVRSAVVVVVRPAFLPQVPLRPPSLAIVAFPYLPLRPLRWGPLPVVAASRAPKALDVSHRAGQESSPIASPAGEGRAIAKRSYCLLSLWRT